MKDRAGLIERQWRAGTVSWTDGGLIIHPEFDYPREIVDIDALMHDLVRSGAPLFSSIMCNRRKRSIVQTTPLGKRFLTCLTYDLYSIKQLFNKHKLSPYFALFASKVTDTKISRHDLAEDTVAWFNTWIDEIREAGRENGFAKVIDDQERAMRKNAASLLKYIRNLHEMFAKLVVVRVDLGYSKEYREMSAVNGLDPSLVKGNFKLLLKYLRRRFPTLVGYVWKLEYGALKSYHYHLMLLFNGHEVREDVTLGQLVGDHWVGEITGGNGTYWNCNAKKDVYAKLGLLGIGTIRYCDTELRANLEKAALYLAKVDYYARLNSPGVGRTFGKGGRNIQVGVRRGRPRGSVSDNASPPQPSDAS